MQVIKNENIKPFDVDDTLVMHLSYTQLCALNVHTLHVQDPIRDRMIMVGVNEPMVRLLEEELHRGAQVIVWSRGGYEWAVNVLKALELDKEDIIVMSKPLVYFDDKDVSDWLKDRVYIKYDSTYKNLHEETKPVSPLKAILTGKKENK